MASQQSSSIFSKRELENILEKPDIESSPLTLYKHRNNFVLKGTIPFGEKKTLIGQKELCIGSNDGQVYFTILEDNMIYIQELDVDCCGFPDYTEYEIIARWSSKLNGWCFNLQRLGYIKIMMKVINESLNKN